MAHTPDHGVYPLPRVHHIRAALLALAALTLAPPAAAEETTDEAGPTETPQQDQAVAVTASPGETPALTVHLPVFSERGVSEDLQQLAARIDRQGMFASPLVVRWAPPPDEETSDEETSDEEPPAARCHLYDFPEGAPGFVDDEHCAEVTRTNLERALEARFTRLDESTLPAGDVAPVVAAARLQGVQTITDAAGPRAMTPEFEGVLNQLRSSSPLLIHQLDLGGVDLHYSHQTVRQKAGGDVEFLSVRAGVNLTWKIWSTTLSDDGEVVGPISLKRPTLAEAEVFAPAPAEASEAPEVLTFLMREALRQLVVEVSSSAVQEAADKGLFDPMGQLIDVAPGRSAYYMDMGRADGLSVDQSVVFYDVDARNEEGSCTKPYHPLDRADHSSPCVRRIGYGRVADVGNNIDIDGTRLDATVAAQRGQLLSQGATLPADQQFIDTWQQHAEQCKRMRRYDNPPKSNAHLTLTEQILVALAPRKAPLPCEEYTDQPSEFASKIRIIGGTQRVEVSGQGRSGLASFKPKLLLNGRGGLAMGPHMSDAWILSSDSDQMTFAAAADIGITGLIPTGELTGIPDFFGLVEGDLLLMPGNDFFKTLFTLVLGVQKHLSVGPVSFRGGAGLGFFGQVYGDDSPVARICDSEDSPCSGFMVRGIGGVELALDPRASLDVGVRANLGFSKIDFSGRVFTPRPTGLQFTFGFSYRI